MNLHFLQPFCHAFAFFPCLLSIVDVMLWALPFLLFSPPHIPEGQFPKAPTLFIDVSPVPHSWAGVREVLVNIYGESKGAPENGKVCLLVTGPICCLTHTLEVH